MSQIQIHWFLRCWLIIKKELVWDRTRSLFRSIYFIWTVSPCCVYLKKYKEKFYAVLLSAMCLLWQQWGYICIKWIWKTDWLTDWLTPWNRLLLEKQTVSQLDKKLGNKQALLTFSPTTVFPTLVSMYRRSLDEMRGCWAGVSNASNHHIKHHRIPTLPVT